MRSLLKYHGLAWMPLCCALVLSPVPQHPRLCCPVPPTCSPLFLPPVVSMSSASLIFTAESTVHGRAKSILAEHALQVIPLTWRKVSATVSLCFGACPFYQSLSGCPSTSHFQDLSQVNNLVLFLNASLSFSDRLIALTPVYHVFQSFIATMVWDN